MHLYILFNEVIYKKDYIFATFATKIEKNCLIL